MKWEELALKGLKPGNNFLESLSQATKAAPPDIKKILVDFPISMDYSKKDIETLKKSNQGVILLLLYYFWISLCGEAYEIFSADTQRRILEEGVKASLKASTLALRIHEKEIEAGFLFRAGKILHSLGELTEAEKMFEKVLKKFNVLAEKNPNVHIPHTASILNNMGLIYYDTHRFSQAETAFKKALEKYEILEQIDPRGYDHFTALALNNLGALYSHTHFFEKAEKCHSKALTIYRRLAKNDPEYKASLATTLNNMGTLYWNMKAFERSKKAYREALAIRRTLAADNHMYISDVAVTLSNAGALYSDIGDFVSAEKAFKEALTIKRDLLKKYPDAHVHGVAKALDNLGNLYSKTGDFVTGEKALKEALAIKRDLLKKYPDKFNSEIALTLRNLAVLYYKSGDVVQSEKIFEKALTAYKALAQQSPHVYNIEVAGVLNEVGVLYTKIGRFTQAEKAFNESLTITKKYVEKNDAYTEDIAIILNNLGALLWDATEFPRAEKVYKKALTIARELARKNPDAYSHYVATTLNNLGNLYSDMDIFLKAEKAYTEALKTYKTLAETAPDVYANGVADTLHNLGALYRKYTYVSKAEKASIKALAMMKKLARKNPRTYNPRVAMVLNNLGALYYKMNNFSTAKKMYKKALTITEKEKLWLDLAETYHNMSTLSDTKSEEAIHILELGILFSGEKKYKYAYKGRRESIYLRFLKYVKDPYRMFGILEALRDPDLLSLQWDTEKIQKAREDIYLQRKMVKKLPGISPLSIPFQIQDNFLFLYIQKMDNNVLYYVVTEEGAKIFRGSPAFVDFGKKLLVNLRVQILGGLYKKDLGEVMAAFDSISLQWTHSMPVTIQELLHAKDTIVISPDAVCSTFPLEGFIIDGEPLCLSKSVVRATSMHQFHNRADVVYDSSLIVGNPWPLCDEKSLSYMHPDNIGPLTYLENAEREARTLAQKLPYPEVLTGIHATADAFLTHLSQYSLIHVAGHGSLGRVLFFSGPATRFPPEFEPEEFARLRKAWRFVDGNPVHMADEWDFVTDVDILNTPLKKGALVFLSACETGKHKYIGGGHFQGLAQAFLKSGASTVISSLIPLYDSPSRDFALTFYEHLFSHKNVGTALQDTRKKMKEKYKAHIYWLPYIHYSSII